jgi:hypothetical protein
MTSMQEERGRDLMCTVVRSKRWDTMSEMEIRRWCSEWAVTNCAEVELNALASYPLVLL